MSLFPLLKKVITKGVMLFKDNATEIAVGTAAIAVGTIAQAEQEARRKEKEDDE